MTVEQLLDKIRLLQPDQVQVISDFIDDLDDEAGLEEDIVEVDRRLKELEENQWENMVSLETVEDEFYRKYPEHTT